MMSLSCPTQLGKQSNELNVVAMDRPRHDELVKDLKAHSVNVILIGDGDVSAATLVAASSFSFGIGRAV